MESSPMIAGSVLIILTLIFFQGLVLAGALFMLGRTIASLRDETHKFGSKINTMLDQGNRLLEEAERLQKAIPAQLEKVARSLHWTSQKIGEVDHFAQENLQFLNRHLANLSRQSDDILSAFSVATFRIHRAIINPTRHVAAALSAVQESVVGLLSRGREKESDPAYPDEQIFI